MTQNVKSYRPGDYVSKVKAERSQVCAQPVSTVSILSARMSTSTNATPLPYAAHPATPAFQRSPACSCCVLIRRWLLTGSSSPRSCIVCILNPLSGFFFWGGEPLDFFFWSMCKK